MSREIKFRAWDLDYKWMDTDFYVRADSGVAYDKPSRVYDTPNIEIEENPNLVIMQYTGLKDKSGVEIYESDIVSVVLIDSAGTKNKYTGKVFYQEYEFCIETDSDYWPVASWHCVYECEVIGNVHQHPELLK